MEDWLKIITPVLLFLLHTVIIVCTSAHIILTKRDVRSAIGWVGIVWLTPFIGATLYLVFGVNRLERKARQLRRRKKKRAKGSAGEPCSAADVDQIVGPVPGLVPLVDFVQKVTNQPLLAGNSVVPFFDGDTTYDSMLAAIDSAKHSVALETYIFDNDSLGLRFVEALERAHERGVEVRVLIDDVGTRYTWPTIKSVLRRHHFRWATFLPSMLPWKLQYTNLRNHRKIVVVDGRIGFTGGMNIRVGHLHSNPGKYPVGDLHFRLEGPVVSHLQDAFASDWHFTTSENLEGEKWFPEPTSVGPSLCRGIADGPELEFDKIQLTLQGAIDCAQKSMTIVTPYFLPEQALITALNVAAIRGVEVRIVIPEKNNLRLVQYACTAQLWQMLQRGCRVFLTPPPFDHTKLVIVDDLWTFFGSANWDPRSLRLNFEFNVECYDAGLARHLKCVIDEKIARSHETTLGEVDARPLWKRLRDGVCRLALPYL